MKSKLRVIFSGILSCVSNKLSQIINPEKLNELIYLRKNLHALKRLNELAGGRKRKSISQYDFHDEGEDEQSTPSTSKKHRTNDEHRDAEIEE